MALRETVSWAVLLYYAQSLEQKGIFFFPKQKGQLSIIDLTGIKYLLAHGASQATNM